MEQCSFPEADNRPIKKYPQFMDPKMSSTYSQGPTAGPCPKVIESSLHLTTYRPIIELNTSLQ